MEKLSCVTLLASSGEILSAVVQLFLLFKRTYGLFTVTKQKAFSLEESDSKL